MTELTGPARIASAPSDSAGIAPIGVDPAGGGLVRRLDELRLDLAALLWPTACVHCGAADRDVCLPCLVELREQEMPAPFSAGAPVFVRAAYAGPLRAALVAFKHEGRTGFARELGRQLRPPLAAALACCTGPAAPVIVAAPSRPSRTRQRGYRPVELLVSRALRGQRVPCLRLRALRTTRGRAGQVGLGPAERIENARRIAVRGDTRRVLSGREVILVDDVITTGATVAAARDALASAGAQVVAIVALCRSERRS
ncbi:hypothetical protein MUN78_12230 [Leucobacter allii]|uniref:Phosphoribosyltransferase domain-containing protein n=1 Tax=Leucobacter allii TaxID=2932247 RepID=A0ABY4FIC2_9MICO|nr:phosphoribosyltransferase family protein [Leucobacter allii]UOQ56438.1 hypothetical protein MUN78_12230 [Leucobacter allii]